MITFFTEKSELLTELFSGTSINAHKHTVNLVPLNVGNFISEVLEITVTEPHDMLDLNLSQLQDVTLFWIVTSCGLLGTFLFRGTFRLHLYEVLQAYLLNLLEQELFLKDVDPSFT
jgi:hypothetical protein